MAARSSVSRIVLLVAFVPMMTGCAGLESESCAGLYGPPVKPVVRTWIEKDGEIYGARPDDRGPIGGGKGYKDIFTDGDYRAATLDELLAALKKAEAGDVVYVVGSAEIDCTTLVYIEKLVLEVPAGVTLASNRGHKGARGAIIASDTFATQPLIRAMGPNVRMTGLRIRGPTPKRYLDHHRRSYGPGGEREKYHYKFPISAGVLTEHPALEVDNCELAGWTHAAVNLRAGDRHHVHPLLSKIIQSDVHLPSLPR